MIRRYSACENGNFKLDEWPKIREHNTIGDKLFHAGVKWTAYGDCRSGFCSIEAGASTFAITIVPFVANE